MSAQVRPPLPVPRGLRPVVRFAKLPASAREVVRRVLDADDEFRSRVAVGADEAGLPRAAWLFLHRPDGWRSELSSLVRVASSAEAGARSERAERNLQRRLEAETAGRRRLEASVAVARAESAKATVDLATERKLRREAEDRSSRLERRVASVEGERDSARRQADADAARVEVLGASLVLAREDLADAGRKLEIGQQLGADALARMSYVEKERDDERARAEQLARMLAAAAHKAKELGRWLAGDDGLTSEPALQTELTTRVAEQEGFGDRSDVSGGAKTRGAGVGRDTKRSPHRLPSGLFDDSAEAAEFLVRIPRMLVLVDGYNATLSVWQELPIADQRSRLVDACGELAARTGAELLVVFDGADIGVSLPPPRRRRVRIQFSPPGIEADDVLLELIDGLEVKRPVTVVSNDRRVRDGASGRGANVLSTAQLFAALRRSPGAG